MRRRLPPLNALKAFEAAARLGSLARAADELCVTRGAVGQQVKLLEDFLGVALFDRQARRVRLAPAGQALLSVTSHALDAIAKEAGKLKGKGLRGRIAIATAPAFGSKWLLSHLPAFLARHPGIDVHIQTLPVYAEELPADCDLAIAYGDGDWPEHLVRPLSGSLYAPLASPRYLESLGHAVQAPNDLAGLRLIHDDDSSRWRRWLKAADATLVNPLKGLFVDNFVYAIDAARADLGVILADPITTGSDLKSGALVRLLDSYHADRGSYAVVVPNARQDDPLVMALFAWLAGHPDLGAATGPESGWAPQAKLRAVGG